MSCRFHPRLMRSPCCHDGALEPVAGPRLRPLHHPTAQVPRNPLLRAFQPGDGPGRPRHHPLLVCGCGVRWGARRITPMPAGPSMNASVCVLCRGRTALATFALLPPASHRPPPLRTHTRTSTRPCPPSTRPCHEPAPAMTQAAGRPAQRRVQHRQCHNRSECPAVAPNDRSRGQGRRKGGAVGGSSLRLRVPGCTPDRCSGNGVGACGLRMCPTHPIPRVRCRAAGPGQPLGEEHGAQGAAGGALRRFERGVRAGPARTFGPGWAAQRVAHQPLSLAPPCPRPPAASGPMRRC